MLMEYPEGATPLDPDEMEGLKLSHIQTRAELDEVEQQNIQDGYRWLERQRKYKDLDLLTEAFSLALHERLFGDVWTWAGTHRLTNKNIGVDYLQIAVELRNLLDDAKHWVEYNTFDREEFAARFHHRLVQIHPFPNGNGRHSRIMTDVILEQVLDMKPVEWGPITLNSDKEHRHAYIQALRSADKNDYGPLLDFIPID